MYTLLCVHFSMRKGGGSLIPACEKSRFVLAYVSVRVL